VCVWFVCDHPMQSLPCVLSTVDQIYHLASPASPPNYMYNPIKTLKTNTIGTLNMLGKSFHVTMLAPDGQKPSCSHPISVAAHIHVQSVVCYLKSLNNLYCFQGNLLVLSCQLCGFKAAASCAFLHSSSRGAFPGHSNH
jgi:hypothetical protein